MITYATPSTPLVEALGWTIFICSTLFTLAWQARAIFDPRNARDWRSERAAGTTPANTEGLPE